MCDCTRPEERLSGSDQGNLISAIFRDTTIEAVEGYLNRDLGTGPCGLTGQLLVRVSPAGAEQESCAAPKPVQ